MSDSTPHLTDPPAIVRDQATLWIQEINAYELQADASEKEASDKRYDQAERVANLIDAGWSTREIAKAWKRPDGTNYGHTHVVFVRRVWEVEGGYLSNHRRRFNEVYNSPEVRRKKPKPRRQQVLGEGPRPTLLVASADALPLDDDSIDLIITSPPYNLGHDHWPMGGRGATPRTAGIGYADDLDELHYQEWQIVVLEELLRVAKPGASLFYNHKVRQREGTIIHPMDWLRSSSWTIRQELIWDRLSTHNHAPSLFWPEDERIYWLTNGTPTLPDHPIGKPSVLRLAGPSPNDSAHPAPFREEVPQYILEAIAKPGDIILDPFGGSMTTCRVAQRLGFASIGVDINPDYLELAKRESGWE